VTAALYATLDGGTLRQVSRSNGRTHLVVSAPAGLPLLHVFLTDDERAQWAAVLAASPQAGADDVGGVG